MGSPPPPNGNSSVVSSQDSGAKSFKQAVKGKATVPEGAKFLTREDLPEDGKGRRGKEEVRNPLSNP
ncbi:hypothetical protein SUGI_0981100 [Cryptomeria japonica]|nr:hypothetical protein SUGI_0981100 [Cryptomeria japonica]